MKPGDAFDQKRIQEESKIINKLIELAAFITDQIGAITTADVMKKTKQGMIRYSDATTRFNFLLLVNLMTFQETLLKMFMQRMADANRMTREAFESGKVNDPKFMEEMRGEFERLMKRATGEDDKIGVG